MNPEISKYELKLFIAGLNPGSVRAIENIREICDSFLGENYDLEVIDIYQQRHFIKEMAILAVPTLVRISPVPQKRIIGDMLDKDRLIDVLELRI